MATIYYEKDADLSLLKGKKSPLSGTAARGTPTLSTSRTAAVTCVSACTAAASPGRQAEAAGLVVKTTAEACAEADIIMMLVPDTSAPAVYAKDVAPNLSAGKMLMFAHGFAIHYGQIVPPENVDVTMVAPKAPGHRVREIFPAGQGVPGLLAIYQDATGQAKQLGLAYAAGIGCARAGVIETTFGEETETDLFGEQAVLCGGVTALMKAGFDTLVAAGYQPEIAYFECVNEMKLIVDLIYQGGFSYMRYSISDTAEHGDYWAGPKVIGAESKAAMQKLLSDIQDGTYAREWILENQANRPSFNLIRKRERRRSSRRSAANCVP